MRGNGIRAIIPVSKRIRDPIQLSKEAKQRLKWVDFYQQHANNARLTCRHFGIHHRTFYRYYDRFKTQGLKGLEHLSRRPVHVRQPSTPLSHVDLVRKLRTDNPEYSKYKLAVILKRDHQVKLSASTCRPYH